jgi:hypothetical protein
MANGHYIPSKTFNLISGLNNILGRAELISSVSAVKNNMSFIGINPDIQPDRIKRMFHHQKINRDYNTVMKFKATDSTQVATLDMTFNFAADVNDMFMIDSVGLLLGINSAASTGSDLIVNNTATTAKGNTITYSKFGGDTVSPQINNALLFKAPKGTSYYQNAVTQLKIHLEIPPNKLTSYSTLSYIHANGIDEYGSGSSFPFIGGDTFSGDVGFTIDNTIVPGKTAALPAASATQRGRLIRIEGGTGVSDGVYICAKLADDTYVWKSIGHDANTTANRPTTNLYIGRRYFDTSLGKPIWLKQTSPAVWVDATGATV